MSSQRLIDAIQNLQDVMNQENINFTNGLPEELFIFGTTLMPVSCVYLFVTNEEGQLLLAWRDDIYYGKGWHIPSGCIRLRESWFDRIQQITVNELGTEVIVNIVPFVVRESMTLHPKSWLTNQLERSHKTSLLFGCKLASNYQVKSYEGKLTRDA